MAAEQPPRGPEAGEPFEENSIAYCGLCCADCPIYGSRAPDLAVELLRQLRDPALRRVLEKLPAVIGGFESLAEVGRCDRFLEALQHVRCMGHCRQGGGSENCPIRACCTALQKEGCWECDEREGCDKLAWLKPVHGDGHLENLRAICEKGKAGFLRGPRHW